MSPRAAAARALVATLAGSDFDAALAGAREAVDRRNRALVQELVYGTLRHYRELGARRDALLERPGRRGSPRIAVLLSVGLYELAALATPRHAAVHAAVEAARELGEGWAAGLVNAVLRRALREPPARLGGAPRGEYPQWLVRRIDRDWSEFGDAVLAAGLDRPPLTLRVNRRRIERATYLRQLASAGIGAVTGAHSPAAVTLAEPRAVEGIPGFAEGLASVQDEAAQLAAGLLGLGPGLRVLDACAAPGGKAAHLLETEPRLGRLVALDRDPARLDAVAGNFRRLGLAGELLAGDALRPASWWDGVPFERILLDAPCTATGVMRRHPDARILRRAGDLTQAARHQALLIRTLWGLLAPGGRLLYAVCSVLREEGDDLVEGFLRDTPGARCLPVAGGWGGPTRFGRRIAPGDSGMDGFYYAVIIKPLT